MLPARHSAACTIARQHKSPRWTRFAGSDQANNFSQCWSAGAARSPRHVPVQELQSVRRLWTICRLRTNCRFRAVCRFRPICGLRPVCGLRPIRGFRKVPNPESGQHVAVEHHEPTAGGEVVRRPFARGRTATGGEPLNRRFRYRRISRWSLALLLLVCPVGAPTSQARGGQWQIESVREALARGAYAEAERYATELTASTEQQYGPDSLTC